MNRRRLLQLVPLFAMPGIAGAAKPDHAALLIAAARSQIGKTLSYDPSYTRIAYPGGDVPLERGVCTDVVIRAYRQGLGIDLQTLIHEDMVKNFSAYPHKWGLSAPDSNIDHRRVPNLQTFFKRHGAELPPSELPAGVWPGDIVTVKLPGNLDHIGIVSDRNRPGSNIPLLIHNIGAGTKEEDMLFTYPHTGRYRFAL